MKITRKQLRRLIAEAFKQKVPLFDPVTQDEIDAITQEKVAFSIDEATGVIIQ